MQGMIQMHDKNPRVSGPKLSAALGATVLSPANPAAWDSWLRRGCPRMRHRGEEHDRKASTPLHIGVFWIADQDSWEVKLYTS